MPRKDDRVYVQHIVAAAHKALRYTQGLSYEAFCQQELVQDAVIRQLEIVGEASAWISETFAAAHPDWPWRQMKDMRNVLIHAYASVDLQDVWTTVRDDLPQLLQQITDALARSAEEELPGFSDKPAPR